MALSGVDCPVTAQLHTQLECTLPAGAGPNKQLVVTTAEPGSLAEVPKLFSAAAPWAAARFVIENRVRGEVDPKLLQKVASGATVTCLLNQVMDKEAASILQAGGLASIAKLDAKALQAKFGVAQGSRIRRDLTRVRLEVMHAVHPAASASSDSAAAYLVRSLCAKANALWNIACRDSPDDLDRPPAPCVRRHAW